MAILCFGCLSFFCFARAQNLNVQIFFVFSLDLYRGIERTEFTTSADTSGSRDDKKTIWL